MKRNKLELDAFEKFGITNTSKISIKGGYPEGWVPELSADDENTWTGEIELNNSTGGPGTTTLSTGVIKLPTSTTTTETVTVKLP
ncbi:hypothetical protein [Flavobacterium sp. H122]|uniref:hypothetical protein n=1 Tax=Flavobacterium sp. H122 TaxID=2529860 RepID=UPI0010AB2A8E|nr:hypothetical protein [Flavobacterium sp. H122]